LFYEIRIQFFLASSHPYLREMNEQNIEKFMQLRWFHHKVNACWCEGTESNFQNWSIWTDSANESQMGQQRCLILSICLCCCFPKRKPFGSRGIK